MMRAAIVAQTPAIATAPESRREELSSILIRMTRALLVRSAAILALIASAGHTIGTFMAVPPEQVAMHAAIATMKSTLVPMPVGAARTYMEILDGNNISTALFLLVCAFQLFAIARAPRDRSTDGVVAITAFGLLGFAAISALYFFPVPTALTGAAAALCLVARTRPR